MSLCRPAPRATSKNYARGCEKHERGGLRSGLYLPLDFERASELASKTEPPWSCRTPPLGGREVVTIADVSGGVPIPSREDPWSSSHDSQPVRIVRKYQGLRNGLARHHRRSGAQAMQRNYILDCAG